MKIIFTVKQLTEHVQLTKHSPKKAAFPLAFDTETW